jgi:hypothetical protein
LDSEMNRLMRALVQVLKERHSDLEKGALNGCPHAEFKKPAGQTVPVSGFFKEPVTHQIRSHSMGSSLGQACATDKFGKRQQVVINAEGVKNRQCFSQHCIEFRSVRHSGSVSLSGTFRFAVLIEGGLTTIAQLTVRC